MSHTKEAEFIAKTICPMRVADRGHCIGHECAAFVVSPWQSWMDKEDGSDPIPYGREVKCGLVHDRKNF